VFVIAFVYNSFVYNSFVYNSFVYNSFVYNSFVYNSFIRIIRFIFYGLVDNTCSYYIASV